MSLAVPILALLASFVSPAVAQEPAELPPLVGVVRPGEASFPLALPLPADIDADDAVVKEIWDVVYKDLMLTGYFAIVPIEGYVEKNGGVEPGTFQMADWSLLKAAALAKIRVLQVGTAEVQAHVFVYDVNGNELLVKKGFKVKDGSEARRLGHNVADTIVYALTHEKSFFASRIAVVGTRSGNKEIYVMDIDGKGVVPVTANHSINLSPAWSPDGTKLAYTSYKKDNADVYLKDLPTGAVTTLSARPGVDSGAAFSPDGTRVALSRSNGSESDIYVIELKNGNEKRITSSKGIDVEPCWSPDGTKLAFASERVGGSQVYIHDFKTGDATRVTFEGWMNGSPAWSPDGEHLAFVGRDVNFDVFVVRTDGTGLLRLTQDQGDNEDPVWSPDGHYLMFSTMRNGTSQIVLSTADGRIQNVITEDGGWFQPDWN